MSLISLQGYRKFIGLGFALICGVTGVSAPVFPPCGTQLDGLEKTIYTQKQSYSQWQAQRARCRKPWTVVISMAADNDLTGYAYKNLQEMEAVGSQAGLDIVVQMDDQGLGGVRRYDVFKDARRDYSPQSIDFYKMQRHLSISSPGQFLHESLGPNVVKKDRGQELEKFLAQAIATHPSEHTWVILWGHGRGYAGRVATGKVSDGGLAFDDSSGTYLSIPTLKRVLGNINRNLLGNQGIDVLSSDACLMQMLEVAADLAPHAHYIQGSAQIQNYFGLPYPLILGELASRFQNSTKMLMANGVKPGTYTEDYLLAWLIPYLVNHDFKRKLNVAKRNFDFEGESAAQSFTSSSLASVTLARELIPALRAVSAQMTTLLPQHRAALTQMAMEIPATPQGGVDVAMWIHYLENFAKQIHASALSAALSQAQNALQRAVVGYSYGPYYSRPDVGYPYVHSRAVTFWVPQGLEQYASRIREFRSSNFYQWTGWDQWMRELYRSAQ